MTCSRSVPFGLLALLVTLTGACAEDPPSEGGEGDAGGRPRDAALPPPAPADAGPRPDGSFVYDDCQDEASQKVFVLTTDLDDPARESHLLRFDPESLTYTEIGRVDCGLSEYQFLRSMAVDRRGTAYASTGQGELYAIDTTTAACRATGMETGQEQVRRYGMGYATVGDTDEERLYITAEGDWWEDGVAWRRLAVIDTSTLTISTIGDIDAPTPANMELTGTGDGRLFGMVLDVRNLRNIIVTIELLDVSTGGTLERKQVPLQARSGFAFAHWGGDFWLFTEAPDGSARVARFDWETGTVEQTVDTPLEVPGTIVGAGVSTCAPYDLI